MTANIPALTAAAPPSMSECRLSTELRGLLLRPGDRSEAVREIAASTRLRDEVRLSLPDLECTIAPAGPQAVRRALAPLVLVFSVGRQAETDAWWGVYFDALADLPAHALDAAARLYPAQPGAEFFPKPAAFRGLAVKCAGEAYQAVGRAREVLATPAPRPGGPATAEVTARIRDDLARSLKRPPPKPAFSPPPTPTDEHGLSAAMKARMEVAHA